MAAFSHILYNRNYLNKIKEKESFYFFMLNVSFLLYIVAQTGMYESNPSLGCTRT